MDPNSPAAPGILGRLDLADGAGVVRLTDRWPVDAADVWDALTDPARLAGWYGRITGDLRPGGEIHLRLDGPDIDSVGRVAACAAHRHLELVTRETPESAARGGSQPFDQTMSVDLVPDGDGTRVEVRVGGLPVAKLAAYGVGWQLHLEALAAHVADRPAPDVGARWAELAAPYRELAAALQ